MRAVALLVTFVGAVLVLACGSDGLVAPPPSDLAMAVTIHPDAAGGMRPATTVSASLFLRPPPERAVAGTPLDGAEFTVWDGAGRTLAQASVVGPLPFGSDGRITVRQVLDWEPADTLGRALTVRFTFARTAPEASPFVYERTITF